MRAATLAHSRDVSTSSAAITHCGGFLASTESGKIANRAPRAPANSAGPRRFAPVFCSASFMPMCESRPASSDMCTRSRLAGAAPDHVAAGTAHGPVAAVPATSLAAWRNWPCTSCHSRTRR